MKLLFIGDISGRPGREIIAELLPGIKTKYKVDFVVANCENAAGGRGVTRKVLNELLGYGIDYFTSGDHVWAYKEFLEELNDPNLPLVRPYNYEGSEQIPGKGFDILDLGSEKLVIVSLIGQGFMNNPGSNPFWAADKLLKELEAAGVHPGSDNILVDFHAEVTSETITLGYYLKNKVSAFLGTHTHVPTADHRLIGNTAYVTDVGMAGPLDASLWKAFPGIIHNFKYPFKISTEMETEGRRILNSVLVEIDGGKAKSIERVDRVVGQEKL